MTNLSTKHLLGIKDLTADDIHLILNTAENFKEVINRPIKRVPSLRDITIANLFLENSTYNNSNFVVLLVVVNVAFIVTAARNEMKLL